MDRQLALQENMEAQQELRESLGGDMLKQPWVETTNRCYLLQKLVGKMEKNQVFFLGGGFCW